VIATERKKLTIFFSDIKDFTQTTERLQPEELTALLNEYFTEMASIAHAHGATVDKFIGDAILAFFGDPETRGAREDAQACVAMAIAMRERLAELNAIWRRRGIEQPFRARMGINTGYCNVGNFGSADRMDYTIIGAEANLAARLESIAEPGGIVMSYETYALVQDQVRARPLAPISLKGISREVVPYAVDPHQAQLAEHDPERMEALTGGLQLKLDLAGLGEEAIASLETTLLAALDRVRAKRPA
jgi:class 3 adenylate cyclase